MLTQGKVAGISKVSYVKLFSIKWIQNLCLILEKEKGTCFFVPKTAILNLIASSYFDINYIDFLGAYNSLEKAFEAEKDVDFLFIYLPGAQPSAPCT